MKANRITVIKRRCIIDSLTREVCADGRPRGRDDRLKSSERSHRSHDCQSDEQTVLHKVLTAALYPELPEHSFPVPEPVYGEGERSVPLPAYLVIRPYLITLVLMLVPMAVKPAVTLPK